MGKTQPVEIDVSDAPKMQIRQKTHSLHILTVNGKKYRLTKMRKAFADAYIDTGGDIFEAMKASKTKSKNKKNAIWMGKELLKKDSVIFYISMVLQRFGFNDINVNKQHAFLINQHADFNTKVKAIDMYYKYRGQYAPEKHEHTIAQVNIVDYSKPIEGKTVK